MFLTDMLKYSRLFRILIRIDKGGSKTVNKYCRSKKGLTLVELVVTIAILGIVSGFSLAIVVTAMNNYSHAAIIEREQDTALLLEEYIIRNARVAGTIEYVTADADPAAASVVSKSGSYVAKIDNVIQTFEYDKDAAKKYTNLTYKDVKNISAYIVRQKFDKDDADKQSSFYLDYHIEMSSGYTLDGQVVLNNAKRDEMNAIVPITAGEPTFIDKQETAWTIINVTGDDTSDSITISPSNDTAIIFQ